MGARTKSFAHKVREALKAWGGNEVSAVDVCAALDLLGAKERRPVYAVLRDMRKRGEAVRLRPGVYRYIPPQKKPEQREILWRVLRSRRVVTLDDLQELSGASRAYAGQWVRMLEKRGVVVKGKGGAWRLKSSDVAMPKDTVKASYLRALRAEKKRRAIASLDAALVAITQARADVAAIETDTETGRGAK